MIKLIKDNKVIDVVENPIYFLYREKSGFVTIVDKSTANCVESSTQDLYALQGVTPLATLPYPYVQVKEITQAEYEELKQLLSNNQEVTGDDLALQECRAEKINELDQLCSAVIDAGISLRLSDHKVYTFQLTVEDQLNLTSLQRKIDAGAELLVYHEKGATCRLFVKEDIQLVIDEAAKFIEYNTTYFNLMRHCINNMYNMDEINDIHYGDKLPLPECAKILECL